VTYTAAAAVGVVFAVALDIGVLRTRLVLRRVFWTSYAIVLGFQLVVDGVLTSHRLVVYSAAAIIGSPAPRLLGHGHLAYAPVEDVLFGFALVLQTLAWWVWWGRRAAHARATAGPATAARRSRPTRARRSNTW
jgi:lycopene cyclase domain-containing protein